jgi:hypothetical protein
VLPWQSGNGLLALRARFNATSTGGLNEIPTGVDDDAYADWISDRDVIGRLLQQQRVLQATRWLLR